MLEQYGGNNMSGKLDIRIAEPIDYDEIIEVFDSWARKNWDKKYAERYYKNYFDNRHCRPKDEVFVGVVNGRIVGVAFRWLNSPTSQYPDVGFRCAGD